MCRTCVVPVADGSREAAGGYPAQRRLSKCYTERASLQHNVVVRVEARGSSIVRRGCSRVGSPRRHWTIGMPKRVRPARIARVTDVSGRAASVERASDSRACERERRSVMAALKVVVNVMDCVLGDHVEIVLHDMTLPSSSVVAIAHGYVSGRKKGDSILAGPKGDTAFSVSSLLNSAGAEERAEHVFAGYHTVSKTGVLLDSSTAVFRDANGVVFAALCLNADLTVARMAHDWLGSLLGQKSGATEVKHEPAKMVGIMESIVRSAIAEHTRGRPVTMLTRSERLDAVASMQQSGLFIVRGGVSRAAKALGVTRFTVYNYLDELRRSTAPPPDGGSVPKVSHRSV